MQPETRPAEENRPQKAAKSSITARKILALIAAGIVLALVISLCISIAGTSRIRTAYANSRNAIGYALYENLQMLIRSYDDILLAGADIEGSILPTMKEYFLAAQNSGFRNLGCLWGEILHPLRRHGHCIPKRISGL